MAIECAYSFKDLYIAAFGKQPEERELLELYDLPQQDRNKVVSQWAEKAHWEIKIRVGTDGQEYFAFAPRFSKTY